MIYRYRLGFADVDFAQLMFSGDYYRWASRAWGTWQLESGLPLRRMIEELGLGLPAIETRCHHMKTIGFEQEFTVELGVRGLSARGFVSDFEIVRVHDDALAAHGYFARRFVDMRTMRGCNELPDEAARVFGAMAEQTRLAPYDERRAELEARRREARPTTPA